MNSETRQEPAFLAVQARSTKYGDTDTREILRLEMYRAKEENANFECGLENPYYQNDTEQLEQKRPSNAPMRKIFKLSFEQLVKNR